MYKFQLYKNTGRGIYIGAIDAITKAYIRKNEVFADAFNYFMYDGAQVIQPECLKELDPTEIAILLNEKDTKDKRKKFKHLRLFFFLLSFVSQSFLSL